MGLFSFFFGEKTDLLKCMKDYLSEFMGEYMADHHDDMPNIAGIFANTRIMLNSMSEKDIKDAMRQNGVTAECAVLNILQNHAMAQIEPVPMSAWLYGGDSDGGAFDLYMAINEEKLRLGCIGVDQYEDNKRLGVCLRRGQRPII